MTFSDTASELPVIERTVHMVARIVATRIMPHPLIVLVDVRSFRMACLIIETLLGLLDLRFGLSKRRLEIARVHAGKHLRRFDHVAFVGEHFGDAPRELGVDIDLVRLDPPVAERDTGRQLRLRLPPDIEPAAGQAVRAQRAEGADALVGLRDDRPGTGHPAGALS